MRTFIKNLSVCSVQLSKHRHQLILQFQRCLSSSLTSTFTSGTTTQPVSAPAKSEVETRESTISKAMHSYLERAKEHQIFMKEQEDDFVFGRRHLANMMGKSPETFTQKDINEAIRYLFPAGLFEPKARPMMKPPQEIYPKQKAAQFDINGRPYHPFFYTTKPNYYFLIHELVGKIQACSTSPKPIDTVEFAGSVWITKLDLEGRLLEYISDDLYSEFVNCLERLVLVGTKELEFIKGFRKPLVAQAGKELLPIVELKEDGSRSVVVDTCRKGSADAIVQVQTPGSGLFKINGKGLDYFDTIKAREMLLFPLQLVDWLGSVDVQCTVTSLCDYHDPESKLRPSGNRKIQEAYVLRWGIAMGLAALGADSEKLRLAGLLTRDIRKSERNRMACDGARARWTWKKR